MTNRALSITVGLLACCFLAANPASAQDGSGNTDGILTGLYYEVLEWVGVFQEAAEPVPDEPSCLQPSPPSLNSIAAEGPEVAPFIPPGG